MTMSRLDIRVCNCESKDRIFDARNMWRNTFTLSIFRSLIYVTLFAEVYKCEYKYCREVIFILLEYEIK